MITKLKKKIGRNKRHRRIRKKLLGSANRPRLALYKSLKNMQAQLVDDIGHKTIVAVTTTSKEFKNEMKKSGNIKAAEKLGEIMAKKAREKGIEQVKFDRGGFVYHGRIKAFAEAARKNGLKF